MNPLADLSLAELLHEVRTAERLVVSIPPRPAEEADAARARLEALREDRVAELERRAALVDRCRALTPRLG